MLNIKSACEKQLTIDYNCLPDDFKRESVIVTEKKPDDRRREYKSTRNAVLRIIAYSGCAVVLAAPEIVDKARGFFDSFDPEWIFEMSSIYKINHFLSSYGEKIYDMHEYFLPVPDDYLLTHADEIKILEKNEIERFRGDDRFNEAFAFDVEHPDMLAAEWEENGKILGMAGASGDSEILWQIGVNVDPSARGRGIGSKLVRTLKNEVIRRGYVPFYGTCASHNISKKVAFKSGFAPSWTEVVSRRF